MRPVAEVLAATIAQPISAQEQSDCFLSVEGQAFVLYRCVHEVDETFTREEADAMALGGDPFCYRLYLESKIIGPPPSGDSGAAS